MNLDLGEYADVDAPVRDVSAPRAVVETSVLHEGHIFDLVTDTVDLGGSVVHRDYVDHPGAVAIIALDEADRVLLIKQYRHAVRRELWEPPAGLLDSPGEPAQQAAARELAEETDLIAESWHVLADYYTTPGASNEAVRIFLARDFSFVPLADRHVREDEEAEISVRWVSLDEAVTAVLGGDIHNPSAVAGVLAAAASRAGGWTSLRPADAPWPERRA